MFNMQRNQITSHPAFIAGYLQNHTYLLRYLSPGHFALCRNGDNEFRAVFKDKAGVVTSEVFDAGKFASLDECLFVLGKKHGTRLQVPLTRVIAADEELKAFFARKKSPLIEKLREAIKQDMESRKFKKYAHCLEQARADLDACIDIDDQTTINIICKMAHTLAGVKMEDGNFSYSYLTNADSLKENLPPHVKQLLQDNGKLIKKSVLALWKYMEELMQKFEEANAEPKPSSDKDAMACLAGISAMQDMHDIGCEVLSIEWKEIANIKKKAALAKEASEVFLHEFGESRLPPLEGEISKRYIQDVIYPFMEFTSLCENEWWVKLACWFVNVDFAEQIQIAIRLVSQNRENIWQYICKRAEVAAAAQRVERTISTSMMSQFAVVQNGVVVSAAIYEEETVRQSSRLV